MDMPPAINELTKILIKRGQLSLSDVVRNREPVFEMLNIFRAVSSIVLSKATGETMWVIRYPGESTYEYAIKRTPDALMEEYTLGSHGQVVSEQLTEYRWYPHVRPWYKDAIAANGPTWGSVYVWLRGGKAETLGVPYVEPYRDAHGNVLGVINCEMTLSDISAFLQRLKVGKTGKAFILERNGNLIATSAGVECMKDGVNRMPAGEAPDAWIATAGRELSLRFGALDGIDQMHKAEIQVDGRPARLVVSPYTNRRGLNWLIVTVVPDMDFLAGVQQNHRRSIRFGVAAALLMMVLGGVLVTLLMRPFLGLVHHVRRVGQGHLDERISLSTPREMAELATAVNEMTAGLQDRMHLRQSLAMAMEVQQNLLPSETPKMPGLDIAGCSIYCDETGGDYYDYLNVVGLSDATVAIAIGDVTGHGIAAAMLMASARGILVSECAERQSLGELLTRLNGHLVRDLGNASERFMTMLLLTIDRDRNEMHWASAGHDMPIVYDARNDRFIDIDAGARGVPLGILEGEMYREERVDGVQPGQIYLAGTDGIWEMSNPSGEMFGKGRLQDLMRANAELTAEEIGCALRDELTRFRGERRQDDDITFVIVKVTPLV